ncbi:2OG-Fe dioxygenase [Methyloglobulus morosus KoM1]|uniref:2OG-Fe dioxygenase n=1 Tax=Methyloglobulus morosus KoM1 TaxID=1116472 RepID=V5BKG2_9GAMM|nr:2OG-Fe dioxygenase family protein [Methyloglobulus morosus]ESS73815.1 2OG-Fe dioxygenase [Methyloglobulus morosus KoM1]
MPININGNISDALSQDPYYVVISSKDVELDEQAKISFDVLKGSFRKLERQPGDGVKRGFGFCEFSYDDGTFQLKEKTGLYKQMPSLPIEVLSQDFLDGNSTKSLGNSFLDDIIQSTAKHLPTGIDTAYVIKLMMAGYDVYMEEFPVHRDMVDYTVTYLIDKVDVAGGVLRLHKEKKEGTVFKEIDMTNPMDGLFFRDDKMFHSVTELNITQEGGHRDIIILGFKG